MSDPNELGPDGGALVPGPNRASENPDGTYSIWWDFKNNTGHPICDLHIKIHNPQALLPFIPVERTDADMVPDDHTTTEHQADGTEKPVPAPGAKVEKLSDGPNGRVPAPAQPKQSRREKDRKSNETTIVLDPCLAPGDLFRLRLCVDENFGELEQVTLTTSAGGGGTDGGTMVTPPKTEALTPAQVREEYLKFFEHVFHLGSLLGFTGLTGLVAKALADQTSAKPETTDTPSKKKKSK